MQHTAMTPRGV